MLSMRSMRGQGFLRSSDPDYCMFHASRCCSDKNSLTVTVASMGSMRSMRGGIISRNQGPLLEIHHRQKHV
jgi:hypothetical protein